MATLTSLLATAALAISGAALEVTTMCGAPLADATTTLGATLRHGLSTMRNVSAVGAAIVEPYRLAEFAPGPAIGLRDALAAIHVTALAIPDVGTAVAALTGGLASVEAARHAASTIQE